MIRIAICDDSEIDLLLIKTMIEDYTKKKKDIDFEITEFANAFKLLECIENNRDSRSFDIYFLDVIMPSINGIETGNVIRKYDKLCHIIFITASGDYALDSYDVIASGYIVKPVSRAKLFATLDRVVANLTSDNSNSSGIRIKTKDGSRNIPLHMIRYAVYEDHLIKFCLTNDKNVSTVTGGMTMTALAEILLKDKRFVSPHRSFVVNMNCVSTLKGQVFILDNSEEIPVSRSMIKSVRQQYNEFVKK